MKQYIYNLNRIALAIGLILLSLCISCAKPQETEEEVPLAQNKNIPKYTIVEIEGCEYFSYISSHHFVHISHKGNCKSPIHMYNKK